MVAQTRCSLPFRAGEASCDSNFTSNPDFGSVNAANDAAESGVNPRTILSVDPKVKIAILAPDGAANADRKYFII